MISFEFVDRRGAGVLTDWRLDARQRRALERKLRLLEHADRRLAEGSILYKTKTPGIWEVEIRGNVQLRPMACFGPLGPDVEVTFLAESDGGTDDLAGLHQMKELGGTSAEICI